MNLYSFIVITISISFIIAVKQKKRGLRFWSSFFVALIAVAGVLGVIWNLSN
jgi:hypothetical protein